MSHLCSAGSKGRTRLITGNRIVVAAAPKGLAVSTDGQAVTGEWTMSATEFRAKCLGLIDEVAETGREIVITKRGRPVARLVPVRRARGAPFGLYRDEVRIHGDIGAPIEVEWEAETNPERVLDS